MELKRWTARATASTYVLNSALTDMKDPSQPTAAVFDSQPKPTEEQLRRVRGTETNQENKGGTRRDTTGRSSAGTGRLSSGLGH